MSQMNRYRLSVPLALALKLHMRKPPPTYGMIRSDQLSLLAPLNQSSGEVPHIELLRFYDALAC